MNFRSLILLGSVLLATTAFAKSKPKKSTKSPNAVLWDAVSSLKEEGSCGAGTCGVELSNVTCTWRNGSLLNHNCSYVNEAGDKKNLNGKPAAKLAAGMEKVGNFEEDCGAGTCGFAEPQNVICTWPNEAGSSKAECRVEKYEAPKEGRPAKKGAPKEKGTE